MKREKGRNKISLQMNGLTCVGQFLQLASSYFHININIPTNINDPPIMILGVIGSFNKIKDSTKVMIILALSIAAT